MAEVEGSDGNNYNIPDFALEDTQEKILAVMKKTYKLSDSDIKNAQKALSNDNKNTKAQIDALNKLGADIKDAVDGKGTFFGGLSDAATGTVGVLSTMGKVVGGVATGFGVLAASAAALAVNLSKGFGDAILPLAESGAAFGELGASLKTTVPELMSFGLSVGEATGAVEGLRANFEILGSDATNALVGKFMEMTDLGSKFGKTQAESIEYLQEEFATRQMLGFFQQRSAAVEAKAAQDMLQKQIDASNILGKSVQEIADGVKSLFGTEDFRASFARMGPEVADIMRQSFSVLTASEVPEELMAGLAKAMSDPIMMASEEAVDTFDALAQIAAEVDPGAADEIRQNVRKFREATDIGDTKAAEKYQKQIEEQTIKLLGGVEGLDTTTKKELEVRGEVNAALMGTMANQNALKIASDKYGTQQAAELADAARTASYFNNIIDLISGSFDTIYLSVKAGIAPALEAFTKALGEMDDKDSPIRKFRDRLGAIGEQIVEKFESIFGGAGKAEGAVGIVTSILDTLGGAVDWAAEKFLDFADLFLLDDGVPLMKKLGNYLGDLFSELVDIIGEQVRQIDIMDVLFGESEKEITDDAAKRVEDTKNRRRGNQTEEQKSEGLMRALSDVIEYRDDKNEKKPGSVDAEKMLEMITKAGVDAKDLTGKDLLTLFPDANDLNLALLAKYEETDAKMLFSGLSNKMIEATDARVTELDSYAMKAWHGADGAKVLQDEQLAIAKSLKDAQLAMLQDVEVTAKKRSEKIEDTRTVEETAKKRSEKIEDTRTIDEKKREEILANVPTETGTQPMPSTASRIETTTADEETSAESPTSQDGTPTQAVKAEPIGSDSSSAYVKELAEAIGLALRPDLIQIATNTKKTASGVASLPDNIS